MRRRDESTRPMIRGEMGAHKCSGRVIARGPIAHGEMEACPGGGEMKMYSAMWRYHVNERIAEFEESGRVADEEERE